MLNELIEFQSFHVKKPQWSPFKHLEIVSKQIYITSLNVCFGFIKK
jgi:hypothetical protein